MDYDVFISSKSEDYEYARQIYEFLTGPSLSYKVFLADAELRKKGVAEYGKVIDEALDAAEHLILVLSKAEYAESSYVENEWRTFLEEKRSGRKMGNILTVLKDVEISSLPISLRHFQSFFFADYKSQIADFLPRTELVVIPNRTHVGYHEHHDIAKTQGVVEERASCDVVLKSVSPTKVKTYEVGDYYDDGKKQGVVFEVSADGKHGKIVSLTESSVRLEWSSDEIYIGADDKNNGANNMAKVKQIAGWREKYPAFAWCADLGDGWYLPAIEELKEFTLNVVVHEAVNRTLAIKGEESAHVSRMRTYWSSTETYAKILDEFCVLFVDMIVGYTVYDSKGSSTYVRAVSAF